jgi:S-adenosylmethionine:tRNA ribosyltransferase-isomerase
MTVKSYTLSDFDYALPPELIAQYPLAQREQSRMLVLNRQMKALTHHPFLALPQLLNPGDLLVLNNAKVIPARLQGYKEGQEGKVEIFLLHAQDVSQHHWQVLMRPARRLKPGTRILFPNSSLTAVIEAQLDDGRGIVELQWPPEISFETILEVTGNIPLPPYLGREPEALDAERYQTVFAKVSGAQAAPTAGLHFSQAVFDELRVQGIQWTEITLNVSAGTFRPVLSESIDEHQMDPEFYTLSQETVEAISKTKANGNRVIAVGTTVAKTLETVAFKNQGQLRMESAWSELFIRPGFSFQVIDALLTNFHLPKSTLLMLVSAFSSRDLISSAYQAAIQEQYRFYSYGDCMLIL